MVEDQGAISRFPTIEGLEKRIGRSLTIETEPNDFNLSKCLRQNQSPLFRLPGEIRNAIFKYATATYDAENAICFCNETIYRPHADSWLRMSTAILLTCRRAWLEANHLPMRQSRYCFWVLELAFSSRQDLVGWREQVRRLQRFQRSLTINNCQNFQCLQLFAISRWLDRKLEGQLFLFLDKDKCPEIFMITIKHEDWKDVHPDGRLTPLAEQQWMQHLLRYNTPPRLREIRLELETIESRASELRSMVNRIRQKFKLIKRRVPSGDAVHVRLLEPPSEVTWEGPNRAGSEYRPPDSALEIVRFRVMTVAWRISAAPLEGGEKKREYGMEDDILEHLPSSSQSVSASGAAPLAGQPKSTEETILDDAEAAIFAASLPEGSLLKLAPKNNEDDDDDHDDDDKVTTA